MLQIPEYQVSTEWAEKVCHFSAVILEHGKSYEKESYTIHNLKKIVDKLYDTHFMEGSCLRVRLFYLYIHVLDVGTSTLKAQLNALQEAGAHSLRGVCWHFTHVLLDAETQLLQATGLVGCGRRCR